MSVRTVCISRNLSSVEGLSNGIPIGNLFELVDGDKVNDFNALSSQSSIFYFKTIDLTDDQSSYVRRSIPGETNPMTCSLNCFSPAELADLAIRGTKQTGLGGEITFSNIIRRNKIGPTWSDDYPVVDEITSENITANVKSIESGIAYSVVVPLMSRSPSTNQVKQGKDGDGNHVSSNCKDSCSLDADIENFLHATGLNPSTDYAAYIIMENSSQVLQEIPTQFFVKTSEI